MTSFKANFLWQKSTKRALLLSALSVLVCISMLIGATFAWFSGGKAVVKNCTLTSDNHIFAIYTSGLNNSIEATGCTINNIGSADSYKIYTDGTATQPTGTITVDGVVVASRS